ncbi:MAG: hypothetical protein NTU44_10790 [Bacteroidetes bacterium]|nr:hypothetical protein [Bacteroidota bacterium]
MKRALFFLLNMAVFGLFAQAPQAIKYQAVARNADGNILVNQAISMRVSILSGSPEGNTVYSETHSVTTNSYGLVNLEIGLGTLVSGNFTSIDWGHGMYFVKVEADENGGSNFSLLGVSQLLSVPYSLQANTSATSVYANTANYSNTAGMLQLTDQQRDTIANPSDGMVIFNLTSHCINVYRNNNWFEVCGSCVPQPTNAFITDIGDVQNDTVVPLQASTPLSGTGTWSVSGGEGGSFSAIHAHDAVFKGKLGQDYTLTWTISNSCGTSSSSIFVRLCPLPSQAEAGPDQTLVHGTQALLNADIPNPYNTGEWGVEKDPGGWSVSDLHDPHATFTGQPGQEYYVVWHVTSNCGSSDDGLRLSFCPLITVANAGPDQVIHNSYTNLQGNPPDYAFNVLGLWTILEGEGGSFSDNTNPTGNFQGNYNVVYRLRWTIYTPCGDSSFDEVNIRFCPTLTTANAGPDIQSPVTLCTLQGNMPGQYNTERWTIISGTGGLLEDPAVNNTRFTGLPNSTYVLRWTIATLCDTSFDEVSVNTGSAWSCGSMISFGSKDYHTVHIGAQCWMKENMDIGTMINGSTGQTDNGTIEKYCYANDPANCTIYGGLYQWDEMMQYTTSPGVRGICPSGFHIPADVEWQTLVDYLGGNPVAGGKMKETGFTHWNVPNTGATNESGFTALGAGFRGDDGSFVNWKSFTIFWNSQENSTVDAQTRYLGCWYNSVIQTLRSKLFGLSARCVRNCAPITTAQAGQDQLNVQGNTTTLAANAPAQGESGIWTIVSGNGGSLAETTNAASTFTGVPGSYYTLGWTLTNSCGSSSSDFVNVSFCPALTIANAGSDIVAQDNVCTLQGNIPEPYNSGLWTIVSGGYGSFTDATQNNTSFYGLTNTTYVLRWTITGVCGNISSDEATVQFCPILTTADAGADITVQTNVFPLQGNLPGNFNSGLWTIVSGSFGSFANPSQNNTVFYGIPNYIYVLRWTINTACSTNSDDITVTITPQFVCNATITYGGQLYHTLQIGTQCWMMENLNIGTMIDGTSSPTNNGIIEKYCYNNDLAKCDIYGGLYQWDEMMQYSSTPGARGICPYDFHIPTREEWQTLVDCLGGYLVAGGKMKKTGFSHWNSPNTDASNESGFTALGAGNHWFDGYFYYLQDLAFFWSSSGGYTNDYAWFRNLFNDGAYSIDQDENKANGFSVRCLKDSN